MSENFNEKEEIMALKARVQELENKVLKLESGGMGTGVYLDGAPSYVKEYVKGSKENQEKVGE